MSSQRLRVGIVGAGRWAEVAHIPGWQRDPRCEIVAICDVVEERARGFAQHFGIAEATDEFQEVEWPTSANVGLSFSLHF